MDDLNYEFSDVEELREDLSFTQRLAQYYSDFLATDFKKGSMPKRRFQTRDKKGRRAGITLEKFSSFMPVLNRSLNKKFGAGLSISISPKKYEAQLSAVVVAAIEAEIKKIDFNQLASRNEKSVDLFKKKIKKKDADLELENQNFIKELSRNVGVVIGAELINKLEPVFAKSAANLFDALVAVDDDISELIVSPIEEVLPTAIYSLVSNEDEQPLVQSLAEAFEPEKIREELRLYFSALSAGDLATEIRELSNVEQLDDNLEFYLYAGEVRYKNNEFPLFYMPFKLEFEGATASLNFEPRLLVNKKAVDYIARVIQELTKTQRASPIDNRIVYLSPEDTIVDRANNILEVVLRSFQFDGTLSFDGKKKRLRNSEVTVTNSLNFALFDKSDESMLTDYEELLQKLGENGGDLLQFIDGLVNSFLTENPTVITNDIEEEWDETDIPNRLVFDTPIPLAEEQRKIVSALNSDDAKFITVEGPPGTGKSHTISAIAFGAILRGQSILVLSDKKEALDVVENKLNETLSKVRPSDDFVNPILRLGRVGTNFKKIVSNKSIATLRTQHREISKAKRERDTLYRKVVDNLKSSIKEKATKGSKIKVDEIMQLETAVADFVNEWQDELDGFSEIFEAKGEQFKQELSSIELLIHLRKICCKFDEDLIALIENFGDDANAIADGMAFVDLVQSKARETRIFLDAPEIDQVKLQALETKIGQVRSAKGIFGYTFSGSKLDAIKSDIFYLTGYRPKTSKAKLIDEIRGLIKRANLFYTPLLEAFDEDSIELVEDALAIEFDTESDQTLIKKLSDQTLIKQLIEFQELIDNGYLPFLDQEESVLDLLTQTDNGEAAFYHEFSELRRSVSELMDQFKLPSYNYLGRKTEIENYNALELASQIDSRVIEFADKHKNDAKTLATIISQKKRFPKDKFEIMKNAFPCMICSLRDYAEYIPLERELFDIIIIDEASQVSIAQAFPAIIRAKKMIVLGDRKQFGNVKTSNASKEMNTAYFAKVKSALFEEKGEVASDIEIRSEKLNITSSILEFMENLSNFDVMLKKHFRGYPEMISFSSKYFYGGALQAMKIRGKPIGEVIEFVQVEDDGKFDVHKNTNELEVEEILSRIVKQLDDDDNRSVAVITPFTEQQTLISKIFSEHERYDEILKKLKFRSFTFDSCQGEERDIIYYSFVATAEKDRLSYVLPVSMDAQDEEELDRSKKLQRMNVAFSRGKEKLVFVHSKPISEFTGGREALNHYVGQLQKAKQAPTSSDVDPNSEAERKVLEWIQQTPSYLSYQPEIQTQFEIGKYLAELDPNYNHPKYRVDFLLRFNIDGKQRDIIIEYDGFEFHFTGGNEVDAGNWRHYLKDSDVEREHVLESYGYKTIRLNRFNVGSDPVSTLDELINEILEYFDDPGDALIRKVLQDTEEAHQGLLDGSVKVCKKCNQNKPKEDFANPNTMSGYGRYCKDCTGPKTKKKKRKNSVKRADGKKKCPKCKKVFPDAEFNDRRNKSGRRSICGACKRKSEEERSRRYSAYLRSGRWT